MPQDQLTEKHAIQEISVVSVSNYCTIIVLVLVIMSVNNNSFS